jgi:hypothetical protein
MLEWLPSANVVVTAARAVPAAGQPVCVGGIGSEPLDGVPDGVVGVAPEVVVVGVLWATVVLVLVGALAVPGVLPELPQAASMNSSAQPIEENII